MIIITAENSVLNRYLHTPDLLPAFKHWFLNIIEQNRDYPTFNRILSRIDECLEQFFIKQWKESNSKEDLDICKQIVLDYLDLKSFPLREPSDTSKFPPVLKIRGLLHRENQKEDYYN